MRRRVFGFAAAILLAIVGTVLLVVYVQSAEDRALEGEEIVEVFVVQEEIRQGAPSDVILDRVKAERVPVKVAVVNAVADLADIEGLVASVTLLPGEQLTRDRLVEVGEIGLVDIPDGHVEVTVSITPERAMVLDENDIGRHVSVLASFENHDFDDLPLEDQYLEAIQAGFEVTIETTATDDGEETTLRAADGTILLRKLEDEFYLGADTPDSTATILQNVLVTRVTFEEQPEVIEDDDGAISRVDLAPTGNLLVTLAVDPSAAERLVFTSEHGMVWFALEPEGGLDNPGDGLDVRDRTNIYGIDPNVDSDADGPETLVVDS